MKFLPLVWRNLWRRKVAPRSRCCRSSSRSCCSAADDDSHDALLGVDLAGLIA
jgi:hypothetical protein